MEFAIEIKDKDLHALWKTFSKYTVLFSMHIYKQHLFHIDEFRKRIHGEEERNH